MQVCASTLAGQEHIFLRPHILVEAQNPIRSGSPRTEPRCTICSKPLHPPTDLEQQERAGAEWRLGNSESE